MCLVVRKSLEVTYFHLGCIIYRYYSRPWNPMSSLWTFMGSILALDESEKFTMVFYNGSRFDCFFIYDWLQKNKIVTNIIYHNGSYKKITFNKNIQTFDLCLFTNTS